MKHWPLAQSVVVVCVKALKRVLRAVERVGDEELDDDMSPACTLA